MIELLKGDCLELLKAVPDESVNLILCDLPYGTSACPWDSIIPLDELWKHYKRIIKPDGAAVLFASQPFTSQLVSSNYGMYKYSWVWQKDNGTNFLNSHYQPLKITEDICVFSKSASSFSRKGNMVYYPQMSEGKPYKQVNSIERKTNAVIRSGIVNVVTENKGIRYPVNVLNFKRDKEKLHPTQKPVALLEYLIKTYTSEGDMVLDNCMGSGSTAIACLNTKRNFIGMEKDDTYFETARNRIENHFVK